MTGEYQHTLDAKGRLFIPARLREELGDTFYLTVSDERCLRAYNAEGWQSFVDRIRTMPYVDRKKMRPFFACAAKCELDAQGPGAAAADAAGLRRAHQGRDRRRLRRPRRALGQRRVGRGARRGDFARIYFRYDEGAQFLMAGHVSVLLGRVHKIS